MRPDASDTPDTPDKPDAPDNPDNPDTPDTPSNQGGGCYVATAVYGSYDCPAVRTLRGFRDNILSCAKPSFAAIASAVYYNFL